MLFRSRERFVKIGVDASSSGTEEFDDYIRAEITRWGKVVKDAGIPLQD